MFYKKASYKIKQNSKKRKDNKSGFKGVSKHKKNESWVASIQKDGKRKHLGSFSTKEEAAKAYAKAAEILHGDFMRLD